MIRELFHPFRKPSARVIAQQDYEDAQRELLKAQAAAEYYARMVQYYGDTVRRLGTYLMQEEK